MKTFTKVCLIISGILAALGLAFCIVAVSLGVSFSDLNDVSFSSKYGWGWDSSNHNFFWGTKGSQKVKDMNEVFKDIDKLKIDIGVVDMVVEEYGGDEFQLEARNVPEGFNCKKEGNTLVIKEESNHSFNIGNNFETAEVTLRIPKKTVFREADFEVGVGRLDVSGFEGKKVSIDCGVGSMSLEGTITGDADLNCGVGRIEMNLTGKAEDFDYDIDCGIGNVSVDGENYSTLDRDKKIDNGADKNMKIECGVGSVEVDF